MPRELTVRFTATFEAKITVEDGESIADAVNDVDIPESSSKYVPDTFEVESVKDEKGETVALYDEEEEEGDEEEEDLDIRYRCPKCGHCWEEEYPSACDSECPNCGTENITSLMHKDQGDDWTPEQEQEWADADKCLHCGKHSNANDGGDHDDNDHKWEVDMRRYQTK
jgi:predicted RNA-binding Zn-ribbon protein involved in translation (DUF1610 family)